MISYRFEKKTPNTLSAQNWNWSVPLNPVKAKSTTTIKNVVGTLGFTVSGLPIYGPTEGQMPTAQAFGDPIYNKVLDTCGGHTAPETTTARATTTPAKMRFTTCGVNEFVMSVFSSWPAINALTDGGNSPNGR